MAATPSTMRQLGSALPAFKLADTRSLLNGGGETVTDMYLRGRGPAVVAFICNHCPFVAISSNDVTSHPQDGPQPMAAEATKHGFTFPYLYDDTQDVARAFDAACTPDFFVFDAESKLAYRGQFDASRPNNAIPVTGADLRAAVQALLAGKAPSSDQKPSIGCGIKWRK
jgi:hypothetical protein